MPLRLEIGPTFRHLCDASAAAPLDEFHFVAASDESRSDGQNQLLLFRYDRSAPVGALDLNAHLGINGSKSEADIESAARVGEVIYWVTSHGRNTSGKSRPNRQRFFATRWDGRELKPWGIARLDLWRALVSQSKMIEAVEKCELAPEHGGLSIEGLCEGKNGTLWLGLRSPLVEGKAMAFTLRGGGDIIRHRHAPLTLSRGWPLDLGGREIRDWLKTGEDGWLVLAGSARNASDFALYDWNGAPKSAPRWLGDVDAALGIIGAAGMHPEAILARPNGEIYLLGDDGDRLFDGVPNKTLPDAERTFRSVRLILT